MTVARIKTFSFSKEFKKTSQAKMLTMATRNSILLIVKQHPGIDYNALLNKIAGNYGSIESARAALSRSNRYLTALGLVAKRGNNLFVTGKGEAMLSNEMQNRLLSKLNRIMEKKDSSINFDAAVELMQTLIERSKQDKDLLLAAKGSVDFYVSDLASLETRFEKRIKSMQYLHKIFAQQIIALKELDFPDFRKLRWDKNTKKILKKIAKDLKANVFTAECFDEDFSRKALEHFSAKSRQNDLFFESKQLGKFLDFVEKHSQLERNIVNLYVGGLKVKIDFPYVYITAPYKKLNELLGKE